MMKAMAQAAIRPSLKAIPGVLCQTTYAGAVENDNQLEHQRGAPDDPDNHVGEQAEMGRKAASQLGERAAQLSRRPVPA